jgi:hypothetical protein
MGKRPVGRPRKKAKTARKAKADKSVAQQIQDAVIAAAKPIENAEYAFIECNDETIEAAEKGLKTTTYHPWVIPHAICPHCGGGLSKIYGTRNAGCMRYHKCACDESYRSNER